MSPKRIALWLLISSVSASAALGIIIVLGGSFSHLQIKIILTTLTISGMSICALACGALWESRRQMRLPVSGAILAVTSALLLIVAYWGEIASAAYWRFTSSVSLLAIGTAHVCLLSLARLASRFTWLRYLTVFAVYGLVLEMIYVLYFTPKGDSFMRLMGATSIVVASLSIVTPIFHRLSRDDFDRHERAPALAAATAAQITCPQCASAETYSAGEIKCGRCGCRFQITILEPGQLQSAAD